jgi:hypothetical protein
MMGYAVDYKPTRKRAAGKARRARDLRNAVRWNLPQLEYDTTGTETVERETCIRILRLNRVAPTADPTGDHCMQQLISDGYVQRPRVLAGRRVFDRDDLIQSLKRYAGVL